MADYFTPTVVQQTIPFYDMTPLDRLLLTNIFSFDEENEGLYFYAEDTAETSLTINRADLEAAIAASRQYQGWILPKIEEQLAKAAPDQFEINLDLSPYDASFEFIFQDIVRRSVTLAYVSIVSSFTCSKMRSDAWGGMAVVITANKIIGKSTNDIIEEILMDPALAKDHDHAQ